MMDLHASSGERPLPFSIDLNETPSSSSDTPTPPSAAANAADAYFIARWFHSMPTTAAGPPADFPGEAGVGPPFACAVCGRPETLGTTLVCDACERGFHLSCARVRVRQLAAAGDWLCGDCVLGGGRSSRWELGKAHPSSGTRSGKRMLDMNALPPSDGDVDMVAAEEDAKCKTNGVRRMRHADLEMENGMDSHDHGGVNKRLRTAMDLYHKEVPSPSGLDGILLSSIGQNHLSNDMTLAAPSELEHDLFLQSLKDFISGMHGSLGEGWHVEFKQSGRYDFRALYCSPDGRKFESMYDVDHYLRMTSTTCCRSADDKVEIAGSVHKALTRRRRRKELARLVGSNNHMDNQDPAKIVCGGGVSETDDKQLCNVIEDHRLTKSTTDEDVSVRYSQSDVQLPLQFEDFFVNSFGKVDSRLSYHDSRHIWPVGYESCWHDRVTGSVFNCQVTDGGDAGPCFRVQRYSCSSYPVPIGETILSPLISDKVGATEVMEHDIFSDDVFDDERDQIQLLLVDSCTVDQDLLSCFSENSSGVNYVLGIGSSIRDNIGEFSVEGKSTSAVWRAVSFAFINACRRAFETTQRLHFQCNHVVHAPCLDCHGSLTKFSYTGAPSAIPRVINNISDLEHFCQHVEQWLNQDRFGLDMDFVQEFLEKIPGAQACTQYELLSNRNYFSTAQAIGSGLLHARCRIGEFGGEKSLFHNSEGEPETKDFPGQSADPAFLDSSPPHGRPLHSKIPPELVGDVFQIWEFFGRFHQILGLEEPLPLDKLEEELLDPWSYSSKGSDREDLDPKETTSQETGSAGSPSGLSATESGTLYLPETTFIQVETEATKEAARAKFASLSYGRCTGIVLTKAHVSLLKILVSELQCRVAVFADPNYDCGELKPRRGRRKEQESSVSIKKSKINMLPLNELTWPELAHRYVLAVSAMDFNQDSTEVCSREGSKVFRCLQGDGGILCGSVTGVAGMEADALLLAETVKQISVSIKREHACFPVERKEFEAVNVSDTVIEKGTLPDWAQVLEPVRKLPTNVGTRIRKCVYESLAKKPPEWARKILERSISKEVYKGNASGPTKKAVLSVLEEVSGETLQPKPKERKEKNKESFSNLLMKLCRVVLRRSLLADEGKVFCNLLGSTLLNSTENDDEGILGSPGQISRPLDFRMIDLRLAVGAYCGCHEAFFDDVCEVWQNIRTIYKDRHDLLVLAESLSHNFDVLYKTEVLQFVQDFPEGIRFESLSAELQKKIDNVLSVTAEMPKAPWEDGVCKVCGIDKDDDSVLLCDTCDSEYHTYCLDPPLSRIPAGNWYCPSCVVSQSKIPHTSALSGTQRFAVNKHQHESKDMKESLRILAASLEVKEYWDLSLEERVLLLKFLCDEVLNSVVIREKIDQCMEVSSDLQMKLRALAAEWKHLKLKEITLMARIEKSTMSNGLNSDAREEHLISVDGSHGNKCQHSLIGAERQSSINLDCQENGSCGVIVKDPNQRILSSNERSSNGNIPQLYNPQGLALSKVCVLDSNLHSGNNIPGHETPLSTLNDRKPEFSPSDHQLCHLSKKQLTDCAHNQSESIVSTNAERKESVSRCDTHIDISVPLSDSGYAHEGIVEVSTSMDPASVQEKSTFQDNCCIPDDSMDMQSSKEELDFLVNQISQLQEMIFNIETQVFMASLRREFLGRDSFGRIFWSMGKPGRRPWLLVDGTVRIPPNGDNIWVGFDSFLGHPPANLVNSRISDGNCNFTSDIHDEKLPLWMIYESDKDIEGLINWLGDHDPRERDLKECILQWQRLRSSQTWNQLSDDFQMTRDCQINGYDFSLPCLHSKASLLLEQTYGPCLEMESDDIIRKHNKKTKGAKEIRMFRCECLEPIWQARHHCSLCHQTFSSSEELEGHCDGKCTPSTFDTEEKRENEPLKGKGVKNDAILERENINRGGGPEVLKHGNSDINSRLVKNSKRACLYDFEEICHKFITVNSNKELVKEIGLIKSNGVPTLLESQASYSNDYLMFSKLQKHDLVLESGLPSCYNIPAIMLPASIDFAPASKDIATSGIKDVEAKGSFLASEQKLCMLENDNSRGVFHVNKHIKVDGNHRCFISKSSLRPLSGKVVHILRKLKMNLLDMDAALPPEALRPSKTSSFKRCIWRAFVKSVETIYEMVQASVLFEGMIRSEYLKNERWYWSSLTAAAKTPTISSLAVRIYSLDASIVYCKTDENVPVTADHPRSSSRFGKRRKDIDGGT